MRNSRHFRGLQAGRLNEYAGEDQELERTESPVAASLEQPSAPPASAQYRVSGRFYAFLIAFVSAVGGFLFGYDLAIMGGANLYLLKQFALSPGMFGFTSASAGLGCIVGPFFGGWFCDRIGRRTTLIVACLLLGVGSVFTAIPNDVTTFNIFRVVGGLGVGLCSIASPMYTNELAPARWRGGLGFMYQLAIVVGSVMAAVVAWLLAKWLPPEVSWRWMFGSELIFVAVFAVLLFLVPESPRWLAERGKIAAAQAIFTRIDGPEFAQTGDRAGRKIIGRRGRLVANCWRRAYERHCSSDSVWRCSTTAPAGAPSAATWPCSSNGAASPAPMPSSRTCWLGVSWP